MTPKRTLQSLDSVFARQNPETLERELILAILGHQSVFLTAKEIVCPWQPLTGTFRSDFSVARYNALFSAISRMYDVYKVAFKGNESYTTKLTLLHAAVVDLTNKSQLSVDIGLELLKEMREESELANVITEEMGMELLHSDAFSTWLKNRVAFTAAKEISSVNTLGVLTMEGMAQIVAQAQNSLLGPTQGSRSLSSLVQVKEDDESVLINPGRFLSRGEYRAIFGPTGVGKSTLMFQMAISFAIGKEFLGMKPNGHLESLIVQSENNEGDLADFREGIFQES